MAKSRAPMMSIESNGTLAQLLTARRAKREGIITIHNFPGSRTKTKATAAQVAVRERFSEAKNGWNELTDEEKLVYTERAFPLHITGYNLYIREFEPEAMKKKTISITSAQILDLLANPVEIIPAPAPGKINIIAFASLEFIPGATPYEDGGVLGLCTENAPDDVVVAFPNTLNILDNAAARIFNMQPGDTYGHYWPNTYDFTGAVQLRNYGSDFTAGDGTFLVNVIYAEFDQA